MKYIHPDYYNNFKCIADVCPKTCCAGWQIEIDDKALAKYSSMNIDTVDYQEQAFFHDNRKRCLNLDENGLCKLITKHGPDILCRTCASFPRHIEEFENTREYSLSISCPEVARMILSTGEPISFTRSEDNTIDEEDYNPEEQTVYRLLSVLRDKFIFIAQDRTRPLNDRMGQILSIAKAFQDEIDFALLGDGDIEDIDLQSILQVKYSPLELSIDDVHTLFVSMKEWEYTGDEFVDILDSAEETLYKTSAESPYGNNDKIGAMADHLSNKNIDLNIIMEQILVYFIYAYFCGSAYDEYYFGQAQLSVATCFHIRDLMLAQFIDTGVIDIEDIIKYTYLYARELEHSIPNILATEAYMDEHPLV